MKRQSFISLLLLSLSLLFVPATALAQAQQTGNDYALSDLEKAVLEEMNQARTNPAQYATYLESLRPNFNGKMFRPPGKNGTVQLVEGASALEEAIRFLRAARPLPRLVVSKGMCMGARDQSYDQGQSGAVSHQGKDKSFSWERVARYGEWKAPVSENIAYDSGTAREIVINLIIDDGVPTRGHRNNIFNSSYIVTGVSCGNHPLFGGMCVCTFAGGFTEKSLQNKSATQPVAQPDATQTSQPKARKL